MKTRLIALLLSAALCLGLAACGGSGNAAASPAAEAVPIQEEEAENVPAPHKEQTETEPAVTSAATPTPTPAPTEEPVVFSAGFSNEPDSLDPTLAGNRAGLTLAVNSFAGLYTLNKEGEIASALAMGMPDVSEDGTVYTIRLRRSTWSDGTPLTAGDFVYSWNRAAREETGAPYGYLLTDVIARGDDGNLMVEASGERRLVVTLRHPAPYFTGLLTLPVFFPVPQASVEAADPEGDDPGAWTEEVFISNGAFCYEGMEGDDKLLYRKNPAFYDAEHVTQEKLNVIFSRDDDYTQDAYESGELDYVDSIPEDHDEKAEDVHALTGSGTYYLVFNPGSEFFAGKSNWGALSFRKAISLLIGRKQVAKAARAGALAADSLIPPGMSDGNGAEYKTETDSYLDASEADVDRARELLGSCGYSFSENEDKTVTVTPAISLPYLTDDSEGHLAVAKALKKQLAVLGIELAVTSLPWDEYYSALMAGNYVLAREGWPADFDDPMSLLGRFNTENEGSAAYLGRAANGQGPDWTGINALLREIDADANPVSRVEKMHRAEKAILESWCVAPLYYYSVRYLLREDVGDVWCDQFGRAYFMYAVGNEGE